MPCSFKHVFLLVKFPLPQSIVPGMSPFFNCWMLSTDGRSQLDASQVRFTLNESEQFVFSVASATKLTVSGLSVSKGNRKFQIKLSLRVLLVHRTVPIVETKIRYIRLVKLIGN